MMLSRTGRKPRERVENLDLNNLYYLSLSFNEENIWLAVDNMTSLPNFIHSLLASCDFARTICGW